MEQKHVRLVISGNVQGVFFRKFSCRAADQLGIKGFVRNQPDGSVYIEAAGQAHDLEQFIAWCHQGPDGSRVDSVERESMEDKRFLTFEIKYS